MKGLLWLLKKYNHVLIFIILEIIAFVLISNHNAYQGAKLINANREVTGFFYNLSDGTKEYLSLRKNNEILVNENASLRNKLEELSRLRLDTLADTLETDSMDVSILIDTLPKYYYYPARVVHSTFHKQLNYLTIDKGKRHGIGKDMAVISEEGIVGIILESSANYSTIIPVINLDFRLSAKVKKNEYTGILQWSGQSHKLASLNEIPYHVDIAEGDSIVTSGYSAIFPEGLFVGTISSFSLQEGNFYEIEVELGTDYQRLFHVNVIRNYFQEEQRTLESSIEK